MSSYKKTVVIKSELSDKITFALWVKKEYPWAIFSFAFIDDLELDARTAGRYWQLQSGKKRPDFHLSKPIHGKHGLYLEFKTSYEEVYNKAGEYINDHVRGQNDMLVTMRGLGYAAEFAIGLEEGKTLFINYLSGDL